MIDVGGNNGAASGHFVAYEFRRDMPGQKCPEILSGMLVREQLPVLLAHVFATLVLAYGDEFHFRRDDAAAGIVHLRYVCPRFATAGLPFQIEAHFGELGISQALLAISGSRGGKNFRVPAVVYPLLA